MHKKKEIYMGARLNACSQNVSFRAFPWGAASKRIGNDEDVETQGFSKVACATTAPMHFQLLELDVLLELLELLLVELSLLLVELSRADLTLSSNSCLRQGISFFHVALVECPLLLLYYVKAILIRRGPWPWNAGACLRGACAELARGLRENTAIFFLKRGGKQLQMWTLRRACAVLALRCGFA